ncbi:hypothetical protein JTB14_016133 [Gonioctena quinquepunctata]|nr:hypothetical protein JTB14_016133 [Gonioctena quinquepunctata]
MHFQTPRSLLWSSCDLWYQPLDMSMKSHAMSRDVRRVINDVACYRLLLQMESCLRFDLVPVGMIPLAPTTKGSTTDPVQPNSFMTALLISLYLAFYSLAASSKVRLPS